MNDHDLDSLRLLTHQQHAERLREAGAGRLARGLRRTPQTRLRLLARINPNLTGGSVVVLLRRGPLS